MDKEQIIKLITGRILDEYRKHQNIDWAEIAARKLYAQWDEFYAKERLLFKYCPSCGNVWEKDSEQIGCWCCGYERGA